MYDPLNIYRCKYKDFIEGILQKRPLNENFEHSSCHHVIPTCCEGTDDEENNVKLFLTHREHFIAHKILTEENPGHRGLFYAYWRMCNGRVTKATSEEYEEARVKFHLMNSGENSPMYGKRLSIETRKKMSISRTGKKFEEETKNKISESNRKRKWSDESRRKLSESLKGRIFSEETMKKFKNRVYKKECTVCHNIYEARSGFQMYCDNCRLEVIE